ncbi:preprotein translocase subunit SecA [bacterium]|nr:preprotein translocase subunit SecA [bacterium]
MVMNLIKMFFGSKNDREIAKIMPLINAINTLEKKYEVMSDDELKEQTNVLKGMLKAGKTLDDILPFAFAVTREASKRALGMRHYDVQMIGGIFLHQGKIAEMKTGEGKTLVATLPVYLNALAEKGVHVVTVNDYLAKRDSEWMGKIYKFLGLTVGVIVHGLTDEERKENYGADITYGTNNEYGFDYLRDNMKYDIEDYVQREHFYCIVDEVDSILIDEARTPLIISGPTESNVEKYAIVDKVVRKLKIDIHFTVDIKDKLVLLTPEGLQSVEKELNVKNLYDPSNIEYLHHVEQSLKAHAIFKEGVDYVVQNGKVIIVDEFTGRLMDGRRWSDGLHQAVEAKEEIDTPIRVRRLMAQGVELDQSDTIPPKVENENQTLASITFQNYFRMYKKLSGMTGTADTEAPEFSKIYSLEVTVIPTNKPIKRLDLEDLIYKDEDEKMEAIVEEIKRVHITGQPVLVGTISIEKSEEISEALAKAGIPHNVLNAKNHKKEANIVAQAGRFGAVTVATNMAGRGTDIILGGNPDFLAKEEIEKIEAITVDEEYDKVYGELLKKYKEICSKEKEKVLAAGGLYILGTERHESRRIDNQLRGRSGRQGDPGKSRFFISLEDELMRRFGGDKIGSMLTRFGYKRGEPITHKMISKSIERAQKRVEAIHFDARKHVLEYDDVMNQQRKTIYTLRRNLLDGVDLREKVFDILEELTLNIVSYAIVDVHRPEEWNLTYLKEKTAELFNFEADFSGLKRKEDIEDYIYNKAEKFYLEKEEELTPENSRQIERYFYLQSLDYLWKEHLLMMDLLRESIGLRGYAQKDPKLEYKKEGFALFKNMIYRIKEDFIKKLFRVQIEQDYSQTQTDFEQIRSMNEGLMKFNLDDFEDEDQSEKQATIDAMNKGVNLLQELSAKALKSFSFEKERQEMQQLIHSMQTGESQNSSEDEQENDDEFDDSGKKKQERKFTQVSRNQRKKTKKK